MSAPLFVTLPLYLKQGHDQRRIRDIQHSLCSCPDGCVMSLESAISLNF